MLLSRMFAISQSFQDKQELPEGEAGHVGSADRHGGIRAARVCACGVGGWGGMQTSTQRHHHEKLGVPVGCSELALPFPPWECLDHTHLKKLRSCSGDSAMQLQNAVAFWAFPLFS